MLRSMYSGISGLKVHQTKLDVIGNNIANVNTVGYKSASITFQEIFSQTVASSQTPSPDSGGTNPSQVGLGTAISSITSNYTNGNIQTTGNPTDLAIDGEGFFVVNDGLRDLYTRAGNLSIDSKGNLVTVNGEKVEGWLADNHGEIDATGDTTSLNLQDLMDKDGFVGYGIDRSGTIIGNYSDGTNKAYAGIAIANFTNPQGLEKEGGNLYSTTVNSGNADIGMADTGDRGSIITNALEMSNVDLGREFTEMIVAQRGFQANSKIITTSDEILQELVNMKR